MQSLRNLFLLVLFFAPALALAQTVPDPVQFLVAPETPGPGQLTQIEVQGVGTFLGDATITWQQNGKVVSSGVGQRTFSFTTGAVGSQTSIHVSINSSSQGIITRDFVFRPSLVAMLWEADTSAPLMYRGKVLYSAGSTLKVFTYPTVIVSGSKVAASSLSFQWQQNGEALPGSSGMGRSILTFDGDELKNAETISVDVYFGAARVARGEITIPASAPQLILYNRDALRGEILNTALPGGIALGGKEITIQAEPYYFSMASKNAGLLAYAWTLGGQDTTGPDSAVGLLTLRQTGTGAGQTTLGVSVQNNDTDKLIQQAQAALQIVFGAQASSAFSSFFGL